MLSCVVNFGIPSDSEKCGNKEYHVTSTVARKMTSEIEPAVINNAYFKPSYKSPYYVILNGVSQESLLDKLIYGEGENCKIPESIEGTVLSLMVGNSKYAPTSVHINYLKIPKEIKLEEHDLYGEDSTDKMEFPDYVCYEIINEFVKLLLENTADPRLSTNVPINQSIIGEISAE